METNPGLYGLAAEFDNPTALVQAARSAHEAGYRCMDAYSPFPVEGLPEALGFHRTKMPMLILIGGIVGGWAVSPCSITARSSVTSRT